MKTKTLINSEIIVKNRLPNWIGFKFQVEYLSEIYNLRIERHKNNMLISIYGDYQIQIEDNDGIVVFEQRIG